MPSTPGLPTCAAREAYVVPNENPLEVLQHATLEARQGEEVKLFPLPDSPVKQTGSQQRFSAGFAWMVGP